MHLSRIQLLATITLVIIGTASRARLPEVSIPEADDWTERGIALVAGPEGSWDARLYGQISPCTVIRKGDTYFLYYVGADGDRTTDGGPAHRALGVATSPDGIHYTKFAGNPILTYLPHINQEEGIFSAGSALDTNRDILIYYGSSLAQNATTESVQGNVALARSHDGLHFTKEGEAFTWNDPRVWGQGDELSPLGSFIEGDKYYVFYSARSPQASWGLGLASGDGPTHFTKFDKVQDEARDIIGGGDPVQIGSGRIALFLVKDFKSNVIEVMTAPVDHPENLSKPVRTYPMFPLRYRHTAIWLDRQRKTWFMYQATDRKEDGNQIIVRTAPMMLAESEKNK